MLSSCYRLRGFLVFGSKSSVQRRGNLSLPQSVARPRYRGTFARGDVYVRRRLAG
jgi:hypothetical protein